MSRVAAAALTAAVAALVTLLGPAPAAQAHAFLTGSNPADGQVLSSSPHELRMDFSESVVLSATHIDLVDAAGRHYPLTDLRVAPAEADAGSDDAAAGEAVAGDAPEDTEAPMQLVATLPALGRSSYRISWETLSSDDLHRTSGVLVFGVQAPVVAAGLSEPAPRGDEAALRWLVLLGLSGALGGILAARLLRRSGGDDLQPSIRRAERWSVAGAALGTVTTVALLLDQVAAGGGGLGQVLTSPYGLRWSVREAGLLTLVAGAVLAHRRTGALPTRPVVRGLLGGGAALACVGTALVGHSGAGARPDVTRVAATAAHLGAATTWAGAVLVLALVLVPALRRGTVPRGAARAVLRRFWLPAGLCVSVMVVTGVYLSSAVVGSVDAALFTVYGRTLLLKLAVAGVAGALALVNSLRLHRARSRSTATAAGDRRPPRRTLAAEALAAVGVLALTAVLTSGQPAMEPQLVASPVPVTHPVLDRKVADLQEAVAVRPNRPGPNVVLIDVFNTRRPSPGPIRAVSVSTPSAGGAAALAVNAEPLADGRWSATLPLTDPGAVNLLVTVRRQGLPDTRSTYRWQVGGGPSSTRPAVVSTAPLAHLLGTVSAVLLGVLALLWLGLLLHRRPRKAGAPMIARWATRGSPVRRPTGYSRSGTT